MARQRKAAARSDDRSEADGPRETSLRIIGGSMRHRKLVYSGEPHTRPMKERVREAVFNLVGPNVKDTHAIDLFAGTGALGLEAISRGATRATLIERHFPTAALIRQNAAALGVADQVAVEPANAFIWLQSHTPTGEEPWLAFCSPPFAFYVERLDDMLAMIRLLVERAPPLSILVVEFDENFDSNLLPEFDTWDIRSYPPATIAILHRT